MRRWWITLAGFGTAALLLAAAPAAEAAPWDAWGCGSHGARLDPCGPVGPRGCHRWSRYARARHHQCRHHLRFHARGSSWQLLRRYVSRIEISNVHRHPRHYWFRRWDCGLAGRDTHGLWGGHRCIGHDYRANECALTQIALGLEGAPTVDFDALGYEARLERTMERFFRGRYEEARAGFASLVETRTADARARYGLLLCALVRKDHTAAARQLHRLHEQGEVSGADRLVLDSCFVDPDRFASLRDGLAAYGRYHFHDSETLVVAAWASAVTGETETARRQIRSALRFAPKHPVGRHLRKTLDEEPAPAVEPKPVPVTPERAKPAAPPLASR